MTDTDDPFERAVVRESLLRRRAEQLGSAGGLMRMTLWIYGALTLGWAIVLAGHWLLFADPRWLVVLHTVTYAVAVGYWLFNMVLFAWIRRQQPEHFGG